MYVCMYTNAHMYNDIPIAHSFYRGSFQFENEQSHRARQGRKLSWQMLQIVTAATAIAKIKKSF